MGPTEETVRKIFRDILYALQVGPVPVSASIDTTGLATSAKQDTIISSLSTMSGYIDGLETLIGTTNTNLSTIAGYVDQIEGYVDGIETAIASTNTKLDTVNTNLTTLAGYVDGIETLIGTTNTNTSSAATSLGVMDDWDESDRAKVNIIVGQAGVDGGTGTRGATTQRVTIATNDESVTSLALIDDTIFADDAAFTVGTSKVSASGFLADETSTDSVDEGDVGIARMTLDRKLIATIQPHTAGGWDTANMTSGDTFTALTNSAQAIKASAGKLGGWYIYNPNASAAYVIIYNVASGSVTVGTTTPKLVLCIPATSAANLELVNGITFDTAISVAAATTGGGNSAPGTALEANFFYK